MNNQITSKVIHALPTGQELIEFSLFNNSGICAKILNLGGILSELHVPDQNGNTANVCLGLNNPQDYLTSNPPYFGAIVGRVANRIANAKISIDGQLYTLAANDGPHHLHGGTEGFDRKFWHSSVENNVLILTRTSPDKEEGYPGNLSVEIRIRLTEQNGLLYQYKATTDATTVVNLTTHPYFNLSGIPGNLIGDHLFTITASHFLPVQNGGIPTGELIEVENSPFDLCKKSSIHKSLQSSHPQIQAASGFDHTFVFDPSRNTKAEPVATAEHPDSGRILQIFTDQPGIQFYTGNYLDKMPDNFSGPHYPRHAAFCLETQHFPDAPNQPGFPSIILRPGETFSSWTEHRFSHLNK